jgi:hypothetical protein
MLWNDFKKWNKRNYKYHKSFYLDFPSIMKPELFNQLDITLNNKPHATLTDYNKAKDDAIAQIGELEQDASQDRKDNVIKFFKYKIGTIPWPDKDKATLYKHLGIPETTVRTWKNKPYLGDWSSLKAPTPTINNYTGNGEKKEQVEPEEDEIE